MIVMRVSPRRRLVGVLAVLLVGAPVLAGCAADADPGGTRVVTSFYPLQYVAQRVAGDGVAVTNLTQPGQEPHDLELTVRQTAAVADADVVLYEKGFQAAVDDAVDQAGPEHAVDASETADLTGDDPHFWLDPSRLGKVAAAFEEQLADADPSRAADYAANLARLERDLTALDRSFRAGLARCRVDTIVVSHDAFGYLGDRYGLDVVGVAGLSPDAEPSPAHLRALQDEIRDDGITTVFSEELASREFADSLATDLGLRSTVLDPVEGLGPATAHEDYLSLMRRNLRSLRKANGCS
jgi:zinc transport system substrate-binding protein